MKINGKWMLALHTILLVYAASSVCSKLAAGHAVGSIPFFLLYGGVLVCLGVYAIGWQQVIKRLPLTTAYANKAVTVVWGMVLGALLFREHISPRQMIGAAVIIAGVLLFTAADGEEAQA